MAGFVTIAVDAMGGDGAPGVIVKGCALALESEPVNIILAGHSEKIRAELEKYGCDKNRVSVLDARETIGFDETPTAAIRQKKNSSIVVGLNTLNEKNGVKAGAFISAGSTGALLTGAAYIAGRIKGVERPALATFLPCEKRTEADAGRVLLIDCGANAECKPSYLLQFGKMGSIYVNHMAGIKNPRVGLVNIGSEKEKGSPLTKEAYELLEKSGLNFIGNVEANDIPRGVADVAVCDGFTGNVILKFAEGFAKTMMSTIKSALMSSVSGKIGAFVAKSSFESIKKTFSSSEVGGAPFLGLNALVVKAHGGSDALAVKNAIRQCRIFIENNIVCKIEKSVNEKDISEKNVNE